MTAKSAILSLLLLTACATPHRRLSCDEACAMKGMACTGQDMGETDTSGSAVTSRGPIGSVSKNLYTTESSTSSSTTYHCMKDPAQETRIQEIRRSVAERRENEEFEQKCNGVGAIVNLTYRKVCEEWRARKASSD